MIGGFTNHLWQSTLFAILAGLLTIAFCKNRAQIRYWLWFSASLKFLVPFAFLLSLGRQLDWAVPAQKIMVPAVSSSMAQMTEPFPDTFPLLTRSSSSADWLPITLFSVWICGFSVIAVIRLKGWRQIRAAIRSSTPLTLSVAIEVRASPGLLEPGVVGLLRPVLLLPAGIIERLTPRQLEAVLTHELCHVRRHDNVSAMIHMLVEALFWFHPAVWWIGARLIEERERACDEEVLSLGGDPRVYAEAILNVCKYYLESPLVCVSGITGADLKKRINTILGQHVTQKLNLTKKTLLMMGGISAVAAPIVVGLANAPAQSKEVGPQFEVASVKPSHSADRRPLFKIEPGGRLTVANFTIKMLIRIAYDIKPFQISGGPDWTNSDLFDIAAKAEDSTDPEQIMKMVQSLLADRFQLATQRDTKEMPVYALTTIKNGPKFKESNESDPNLINLNSRENPTSNRSRLPVMKLRRGLLVAQETTMPSLAFQLSNILGRMVVDKTGLKGKYDVKIEWQPDETQIAMFEAMRVPEGFGAPPPDPQGPSLFAALQEQLGLKLESNKGPVEVFTIEHVERPSAN